MPEWLIVLLLAVAPITAFVIGHKVSYRRELTMRQYWIMSGCTGLLFVVGLLFSSQPWSAVVISAGACLAAFQLGVERRNWRWLRQEWRKFRQARKARS